MPANVWIRRVGLADSDGLERIANEHLQEVEARGGRLVNSFFATAPSTHTTIVILTLITDEPDASQDEPGLA